MSDEQENLSTESVFDYYKSIGNGDRQAEADLIAQSIRESVVPDSLRYGIFRNVYRGIIKSTDGDLYYFNRVPNGDFRLVKADGQDQLWDANRLMKNCDMGCDLRKSDEDVSPEEDEETEKAEASSGVPGGTAGAAGSGAPPAISESQALKEQARLLTEQHPGAVSGGHTPDLPTRGRQWHEEQPVQQPPAQPVAKSPGFWNKMDLVKGLAASLQRSDPRPNPPPDPREQQFLTEMLGRTPNEVQEGHTQMSPTQRVQYNVWCNKAIATHLGGLTAWRKKNG